MKQDKVLSMLGLSAKAGNVASGEFSTEKAVKEGKDSISATGKRILYSVGIQNRRIILCMMQK